MAHGFRCCAACGIFPDQGSNLCLLHWQADSTSEPPRKPLKIIIIILFIISFVLNNPKYFKENPKDGGAWWAAVHGVSTSRTGLSDFTFTFHFHALEKEVATHSSVLAWRIPGLGEPGGLLSMGSHRVGHDWSDLAAAAAGQLLLFFFKKRNLLSHVVENSRI